MSAITELVTAVTCCSTSLKSWILG